MDTNKSASFQSLRDNVGRFKLTNKTCLIPEMNRMGAHLLGAAFRGFGIQARVMETGKGMDLGLAYTSGKECYPCQVTTGDILYALQEESRRLGKRFQADNYVYFMPEADGPCRFGMYNKYQRIVLDGFPEFRDIKIGALTTIDGYSLAGLIEDDQMGDLRKTACFSQIVGDILDRLLWRIRPYEKAPGLADDLLERALVRLQEAFEIYGREKRFDDILRVLDQILREGKALMDPSIPRKPLIGIVGEIYLRTHVGSNQDVIRVLERYGAEVVNASIAEWMNYTSYDRLREAREGLRLSAKLFRFKDMKQHLKKILSFGGDLAYQQYRQNRTYRRVHAIMDIAPDHAVAHLEDILKEDDLFCFDVGTEACLSIAGIVSYVRDGFNGIVNVYPFTCMPSTTTSAIVRPLMDRLGVPYMDTPYDSSFQPGREAAIRTFMYQAEQHFRRHGRGRKRQVSTV